MMRFVLWNSEGNKAERTVEVFNRDQLPVPDDGTEWVAISGPITTTLVRGEDGSLQELGFEELHPTIVPIDHLKNDARRSAKAHRDARQEGGCTVPSGKRVQTDAAKSQPLIALFVAEAREAKAAAAPYGVHFRMQDNTEELLDADGMIAIGVAVSNHLRDCHAAAKAIIDQIDAAVDEVALKAIDITAGYPA
jgi:hypothetical protein